MSTTFSPRATNRPRLLVIDRDSAFQRLIYRLYRPTCDVHAAFSATLGLHFAQEQAYDLVLLTTNLPKPMQAARLFKKLTAVPGYAHVPIVGLHEAGLKPEVAADHLAAVLRKPASIEGIQACLSGVLGQALPSVFSTVRPAA
ncbi:MAG: hypothetical protein AAGI71_04140 [Bacteroidota bacterium]